MSYYGRGGGGGHHHNGHHRNGGYRGDGNNHYGSGVDDDQNYSRRRSDEDRYRRNDGDYHHRYSNQRDYDGNRGVNSNNGSAGYNNGNQRRYGSTREQDGSMDRGESSDNSKRSQPGDGASSTSRNDIAGASQKRAKSDHHPTAFSTTEIDDDEDLNENEKARKQEYKDCLRECDKSTYQISRQAFQRRANWDERKSKAAEATIERLKDLDRGNGSGGGSGGSGGGYDGYSSSEDSCPPPGVNYSQPHLKGLTESEKKFVRALRYCPPLDSGFHIVRSGHTRICYCPCGDNLEPWRDKHGILLNKEACTKSNFTPNFLMDHLKVEGGMYEEKERKQLVKRPLRDIYHYATKVYLLELYSDWHGKDFAHKGLHPTLSHAYRKAEDEETRLLEREIIVGRREICRIEEENARLESKLEQKEKEARLFKKLARDHEKQIRDLKSIREKLHVEKKVQNKLSDGQVAKYKKVTTYSFDSMKCLAGELKDVTILVMSESGARGFSLQQFFDELYPKKTEARTALFGNESKNAGNKITKLILAEWKITFDKEVAYEGESKSAAKKRKKEDTGIDEGGPSRQFLTEVFKQLDMLSIKVGNVSVKLFDHTPAGAVVTTDDNLYEKISSAAKKFKPGSSSEQKVIQDKAIHQAKDYSRAIGRIMLHAFSHKQTLPNNAMPPFFMNVLLHGYDDDYDHDDILTHTSKVGILGKNTLEWLLDDNKDETDENGDAWTKETIFRSYIPKNFIHTRKILLGSLQDGLTFGGKPDPSAGLEMGCGLSSIFAMVPIEAIEQIYFARPKITVEDLWAVLKPKFGEGEPDPNIGIDEEGKETQINEQKKFFHGDFKKYLEESAEEDDTFLAKFLECATGSNYLPYDKNFGINIEFNFSLEPLGFPNFHSCSCDVVMPGFSAFFSDYKTFKKEKMNFAIDEVYNQFQMN